MSSQVSVCIFCLGPFCRGSHHCLLDRRAPHSVLVSARPVPDQLEQKILQALRKAGSPMRTPLLVRECQVPKQQLNRVLYQMLKESKVSLVAPATWSLGGGDPGALVPAQPAQPSIGNQHEMGSPRVILAMDMPRFGPWDLPPGKQGVPLLYLDFLANGANRGLGFVRDAERIGQDGASS